MIYNNFGGSRQLAVLVDSREKKLLKKFKIPVNIRQIVCGDIQIWEKSGVFDCEATPPLCLELNGSSEKAESNPDSGRCSILIERKTWKDFAASIADGRYKSQHNRMREFQKKNGSLIYYCIEGRMPNFPAGKSFPHTNIKPDHLLERIDRWSFDTSMPVSVLYTRDPADTCSRICKLLKTYSKIFDATATTQHPGELTKAPENCRTANTDTQATPISDGWLLLRGISTKTQKLIANNFRLVEFLTMSANNPIHVKRVVDAFRLSGAHCGSKKAMNLLNVDSVRFFSKINGISRNRALAIVTTTPECLQQLAGLVLTYNANWDYFSKSSLVDVIKCTPGFRSNRSILRKLFDTLVQDIPQGFVALPQ